MPLGKENSGNGAASLPTTEEDPVFSDPICDDYRPSAAQDTTQEDCENARNRLLDVTPELEVSREVIEAGNVPPELADLRGSELERILVRQWNAVQALQAAMQREWIDARTMAGIDDGASDGDGRRLRSRCRRTG